LARQFADDKIVEISHSPHIARLFVMDVNLKGIFDSENEFDDVQAHLNSRFIHSRKPTEGVGC